MSTAGLKVAFSVLKRSSEGSLGMPEQFRFQQGFRESGQVDGVESGEEVRREPTRFFLVGNEAGQADGASHQFLPGAGWSAYQGGDVA